MSCALPPCLCGALFRTDHVPKVCRAGNTKPRARQHCRMPCTVGSLSSVAVSSPSLRLAMSRCGLCNQREEAVTLHAGACACPSVICTTCLQCRTCEITPKGFLPFTHCDVCYVEYSGSARQVIAASWVHLTSVCTPRCGPHRVAALLYRSKTMRLSASTDEEHKEVDRSLCRILHRLDLVNTASALSIVAQVKLEQRRRQLQRATGAAAKRDLKDLLKVDLEGFINGRLLDVQRVLVCLENAELCKDCGLFAAAVRMAEAHCARVMRMASDDDVLVNAIAVTRSFRSRAGLGVAKVAASKRKFAAAASTARAAASLLRSCTGAGSSRVRWTRQKVFSYWRKSEEGRRFFRGKRAGYTIPLLPIRA